MRVFIPYYTDKNNFGKGLYPIARNEYNRDGKGCDNMTQAERRQYLIRALLSERGEDIAIPSDSRGQQALLRALFNVRMPQQTSEEFLKVQDAYLSDRILEKGITDIDSLSPVADGLYLWQGDITTLRCGAIVNAANAQMLGCFVPGHTCIDNAIHTYAGVQLRAECARIMRAQGYEEPTGQAKITPAYNLPCDYVIHTVGPIVSGRLTRGDCALLESCYRSCLTLADENGCGSIAFCCISTGVFGFPQREAAHIAVDTVRAYRERTGSGIRVIFNVFKDEDLAIYRALLQPDCPD